MLTTFAMSNIGFYKMNLYMCLEKDSKKNKKTKKDLFKPGKSFGIPSFCDRLYRSSQIWPDPLDKPTFCDYNQ